MEVKISRYGAFWGCSKFPDCKTTDIINQEIVKNIVQELTLKCSNKNCNGNLKYIKTSKSAFLGCENYPDCDYIKFF